MFLSDVAFGQLRLSSFCVTEYLPRARPDGIRRVRYFFITVSSE